MTVNIVPFQFGSSSIRVVLINGEPWFVGKDVCDVLEIGDPSTAYARLKDYEKLTRLIPGSGQNREMVVISESGLYRLVLTSRKPQAEPFQDWVVQEVLPSIRKTGSYSAQPQQPKLPANKVALEISRDIREITDNLTDNPRLAQFLIDHAISGIMPAGNTLAGAKLKGVVGIAEEMGFSVGMSNRSQLGKFVKARCEDLVQQEERLVNGQIRAVACYPCDSDEVRQAITDFFVK